MMVESTTSRGVGDSEQALLDEEIRAELAARPKASARRTGLVLLLGSIAGWIASLALSMDKLLLLENPNASLACDINPLISCGTFIQTWQASAFGFPNMFLGLGGFAIMGAVGSLMLSQVRLPHWFRWATWGGVTFAFAFVLWLAFNALFAIHALCPWCLVVWAACAPMFFSVTAHLVEDGTFGLRGLGAKVLRAWVPLTLAWYAVVVLTAFFVFLPQWIAMFS